MAAKYLTVRPYLANIFQDNLRFDPRSLTTFFNYSFDLVKLAEQFVDARGGGLGDERFSQNPRTRIYESELFDISFIRLLLVEYLILFQTLELKIENYERKYPNFGQEAKITLKKFKGVVARVAEKIIVMESKAEIEGTGDENSFSDGKMTLKAIQGMDVNPQTGEYVKRGQGVDTQGGQTLRISKTVLSFSEYMRKMLVLEEKWIAWKNNKCTGSVFKSGAPELKRRLIKRRFFEFQGNRRGDRGRDARTA